MQVHDYESCKHESLRSASGLYDVARHNSVPKASHVPELLLNVLVRVLNLDLTNLAGEHGAA